MHHCNLRVPTHGAAAREVNTQVPHRCRRGAFVRKRDLLSGHKIQVARCTASSLSSTTRKWRSSSCTWCYRPYLPLQLRSVRHPSLLALSASRKTPCAQPAPRTVKPASPAPRVVRRQVLPGGHDSLRRSVLPHSLLQPRLWWLWYNLQAGQVRSGPVPLRPVHAVLQEGLHQVWVCLHHTLLRQRQLRNL